MTESQNLIAEYAKHGSETAFRELVERYLGLVYSTALRLVDGDSHLAQDVAQIAFVDLARRARNLSSNAMLGGWLHRHTCFVARTVMRGRRRRQARETQALEMNMQPDHSEANLAQVRSVLDEVVNQLPAGERTAILLRFFEQREYGSVGDVLGINEEAARKRVSRALDKLHAMLKRRGVTLSAAALGGLLTGHAVVAAPAGLAVSISSFALSGAAAGTGTTLAFLKLLAMTKSKLALLSALVVAGMTIPLAVQYRTQARLRDANEALRLRMDEVQAANERLAASPAQPRAAARPPREQTEELLRLRGEVERLRTELRETAGVKTNAAEKEVRSGSLQVAQVKARLQQKPTGAIPEFQFLNDEDWFRVVDKDSTLDTDADYRIVLARLRDISKSKFAELAMGALNKYASANDNRLPDEPTQLGPFFDTPLADGLLERYKMSHAGKIADLPSPGAWVMEEKGPVDEAFDSGYAVGLQGYSHWGVGLCVSPELADNYLNAVKAFKVAHPGLGPASSSELQPYLKQPVNEALLEKVFHQDSGNSR